MYVNKTMRHLKY